MRVREAGNDNAQFIAGDVQTLDLEERFDALGGRLVLMYLPDPTAALKQLLTRLHPGGIVMFQEIDFTITRSYRNPDTSTHQPVKRLDRRSIRTVRGERHHGPGPAQSLYGGRSSRAYPRRRFTVGRIRRLARIFICRQFIPKRCTIAGTLRDSNRRGSGRGYHSAAGPGRNRRGQTARDHSAAYRGLGAGNVENQ